MSERIELTLSGMTCHACAELIQDELRDAEGVVQAEVSFEGKRALVEFDAERTAPAQIIQRIGDLGYQATQS